MKFVAIALLAGLSAIPAAAHAQGRVPIPNPVQAPAVGVQVVDPAGAPVGRIESMTTDLAVIDTGTNKVSYPITSMTPGPAGPIIALTKAQLDASVIQQQAKARADLAARLVAGTAVFASDGTTQIGTIKAADPQFVTITATSGTDVKLPTAGFASGQTGVVVGLSAADFAKAIGGTQ